jgi:hypothetical protein
MPTRGPLGQAPRKNRDINCLDGSGRCGNHALLYLLFHSLFRVFRISCLVRFVRMSPVTDRRLITNDIVHEVIVLLSKLLFRWWQSGFFHCQEGQELGGRRRVACGADHLETSSLPHLPMDSIAFPEPHSEPVPLLYLLDRPGFPALQQDNKCFNQLPYHPLLSPANILTVGYGDL